jgi:hypothetical protein
MPFSSAAGKRRSRISSPCCLLFLFVLALAVLLPRAAFAEEAVNVTEAALKPVGEDWAVSAVLQVRLNRTQEEALKKGIPLNFVTEFKLQRVRTWWFNEDVLASNRVGRLNYSPLTRRYQLETVEGFKAYDTPAEALTELGRIENWVVAPSQALKAGNAYRAALRMRLDVGQLSKPLQINALASGKWEVEGDWYEWEVTP